jgi:hypothetical protein
MYENEFESAKGNDSLEESIADDLGKYLEVLNQDMHQNSTATGKKPLDRSEGEVDFASFTGDVPIYGNNVKGEFDFTKKLQEEKDKGIEPGEKVLDGQGKDVKNW